MNGRTVRNCFGRIKMEKTNRKRGNCGKFAKISRKNKAFGSKMTLRKSNKI